MMVWCRLRHSGRVHPHVGIIPILCSGVSALLSLIIPLITRLAAAARRRGLYTFFYYSHHLFVGLYGVVVIHTIDDVNREGQNRYRACGVETVCHSSRMWQITELEMARGPSLLLRL